jgi:hypothetical protein
MARLLYGGKMSPEMKAAVSKFETSRKQTRPFLIQLGFFVFSTIDKLNDFTKLSDSSVSIYALSQKSTS